MTYAVLQNLLAHRVTLTIVIILGALLLRGLVIRRIRRTRTILTVSEHRAMSTVHVTTVMVILLTVLVLWLPQIQEFILSITAIAVAIVIATKELSLCLLGAFVIRTSRAFAIGDWISLGPHFGEVIERNFMTTTIQEIERRGYTYTGRTAVLPNSLFLTSTVTNQNFLRRYQFHSFDITIEPDAFPIDAEDKLQARIEAITGHFIETAQRYNKMLEQRTGIDIPDAQPTVEFSTNEAAKLVTTLSVFCPTDQIMTLEKAMMKEFFEWYRANRESRACNG
ncbi:mechanosensitive ion channel family protein [Granulosicoccus sp. 3-233]|uniref:mechanosensitive ion channel family protein n=1 Tax=Granulosicoccus sp. 3-233 TaxID=3417969 RepID=UPI003D34A86A